MVARGWGEGEDGERLLRGVGFYWGESNENVLESDSNDSCTTLRID